MLHKNSKGMLHFLSKTILAILTIWITPAITSPANQEELGGSRMLLSVIKYTWDAENFGKILGIAVRAIMLICFVLMWIDCFSRFGGKSKQWMGAFHFIVFFYGASTWVLVGSEVDGGNGIGYRSFNFPMFMKFREYMFNTEGYFGSGHPKIFAPIENSAGVPIPVYSHYWNALFWEITIYLILRIISLVAVLSGQLKKKSKWAHLIDSLFVVYAFSWGATFIGHALRWFKQAKRIGELNDSFTKQFPGFDTFKQSGGGYYIAWVMAIYMTIEVIWIGYQSIRWTFKSKDWLNSNQNRSRAGSYTQGQNLQPEGQVKGCLVQDVYVEIALAHMNKKEVFKSPISLYYVTGNRLRWVMFASMAILFIGKPRTVYWVMTAVGLIMVVWTILALKGINKIAGVLMLIEEILVFLWHLSQTILWTDLGTEKKSLGLGWVWFFVITIQVGFFGCLVIELILLFMAILGTENTKEEAAPSEDIRLDDLSNNDLDNKIQSYNTMKSKGVVGNDKNAGVAA